MVHIVQLTDAWKRSTSLLKGRVPWPTRDLRLKLGSFRSWRMHLCHESGANISEEGYNMYAPVMSSRQFNSFWIFEYSTIACTNVVILIYMFSRRSKSLVPRDLNWSIQTLLIVDWMERVYNFKSSNAVGNISTWKWVLELRTITNMGRNYRRWIPTYPCILPS